MQRHDHVDVRAVAIMVLLCALWGLQAVLVKVAIAGGLPPVFQAGVRSVVAAGLVTAWIGLRRGGRAAAGLFAADAVLAPGLAIAVLFAGEFLTLFPGLQLTSASRGVLFLYTAPFFTALGTHWLIPAERMGWRQAVGLLIAFGGVAVTLGWQGFGGGTLAGDLLCLAAGALWGATTVVVKANAALSRASAARVLVLQLAGSAPLLLAASAGMGERWDVAAPTGLAWFGLFYQTAVVAFASYLTWFWLILAYPAGRIAAFTFLTPLFGVLAGALVLGEAVPPALLAGLGGVAVGLRLLNGRR